MYTKPIGMVLMSDGNSNIGAHIKSYLSYLTRFRRLDRGHSQIGFFFSIKDLFSFIICSELPFNISTMGIGRNFLFFFHVYSVAVPHLPFHAG